MRPADEFDAIIVVGTLQGGARQVALWKLLDRCCHPGRTIALPRAPYRKP